MSTDRVRRRVEDEAAAEEPWTLQNYEWDPVSLVARKKRVVASGPADVPVATATAFHAALGFGLSDASAGGTCHELMQQQLAADPKLGLLPVLETVDRTDAEPATHCEVLGCGVSLAGLKRYYVRMRVCEQHLHAPAILVNGVISRFCQQCAKFQFVGEFSGSKKSCAATLERHNARHRAKVMARLQEQQDADSDAKPGTAREKGRGKGLKRQNSSKPVRVGSDAMAAAIATAAAAATAAAGTVVPTSSSDASGMAFPPAARPATAGAYCFGSEAPLYPTGLCTGPAAPTAPVYSCPQSSGGPVSADGTAPTNPGSPSNQAMAAWDGATSAGLPPRPLVTTGGNGVVSRGEYLPSQGASGSMGAYLPQQPQQQQQQQPLVAPSLPPHVPSALPRPSGQWAANGGAGSMAGWESYHLQHGATGHGAGAQMPSYDVCTALGALQGHLLAEVPPGPAGLPLAEPQQPSHAIGIPGTLRAMPTPQSRVAVDAGIDSRGSAPAAMTNGAVGGLSYGLAAGDAWRATGRQAPLASGPSDGEGRASCHDGLGGARTPSVPTHSGGEPCGSSGGVGGGGSSGVQEASPACSLNEGVSATRVSGSGIAGGDASKGGESAAATGVAARINMIMEELCPLIEQFKHEVAQGGLAMPPHPGTAFHPVAHGASQPGQGPAGDNSSAGAAGSWSGGRAPRSGPSPPPSGPGPLQDRVGSNSLPPLPRAVDSAVAMMKQASSQLAAVLQPGQAGAPAVAPPGQQWVVTSGMPDGTMAGGLLQPQLMQGLEGIKQEPRPPPARPGRNPFAISQPPQQPPLQAPQPSPAPAPPGWRQLASNPGVMVNVGSSALAPPPRQAALPPQQQLLSQSSGAPQLYYPPLQPGPPLPSAAPAMAPPPDASALAFPGGPSAAGGSPPGPTNGVPGQFVAHPTPQGVAAAVAGPAALAADPAIGDGDAGGDDDLMKQLLSYLEEPEDSVVPLTHAHSQHPPHAQPGPAFQQHMGQPPPMPAPEFYHSFAASVQHSVLLQQHAVQSMPYGSRASPFAAWNGSAAPPPLQPPPGHPHGPPFPPSLQPPPCSHMTPGSAPYSTMAPAPPPQPFYQHLPGPAGWGTMAPLPAQVAAGGDLPDVDDVDPRELTRISLKAMNVLPHELPSNLRANLRRWLKEARTEALQATLRPGCVQLVVDVRCLPPAASDAAATGAQPDLASLLIPQHDAEQAAVDVFRILGQRLRDIYVQVDRRVLQIRVRERPVVLGWEEAAEDGGLDGAKYPALKGCSAAAVCAGAEARLELQGANLAHAGTKAFARLRGHDLSASLLPHAASPTATAAADAAADGGCNLRMSVAVPPGAVGLMVVEVGVGHLLGDWWPVLVLPRGQEGSVAELQALQVQAQQAPATEANGRVGPGAEGAPLSREEGFRRLTLNLASVLETLHDAITSAASSDAAAATAAQSLGSPRPTAADPGGRRSSSPDYGASRSSMSDAGTATGWTDTITSSGLGSTLASLATSSAYVLGPMLAAAGGSAALLPGQNAAGGLRHAVGGTPIAAPPDVTIRLALSRTARLLRYVVARGLPHLTGLLLAAADGLVHFLEPSQAPGSATGQADHAQRGRAELLKASGVDPQALLPLAVLSSSADTVDRLAAFTAGVMGAPVKWHLPQGPHGMSLLHMAALLPDGGALGSHIVATQAWAAWEWLSLGWAPPSKKEQQRQASRAVQGPAASSAVDTAEQGHVAADSYNGHGGDGEAAVDEGFEEDGGEDEEDGESDDEVAVEGDLAPAAVRLTPGFLSLLLGQEEPVRRAVAALTVSPVAAAVAPAVSVDDGAAVAALLEAVEAWGRSGCTLLSALCERLARQKL